MRSFSNGVGWSFDGSRVMWNRQRVKLEMAVYLGLDRLQVIPLPSFMTT